MRSPKKRLRDALALDNAMNNEELEVIGNSNALTPPVTALLSALFNGPRTGPEYGYRTRVFVLFQHLNGTLMFQCQPRSPDGTLQEPVLVRVGSSEMIHMENDRLIDALPHIGGTPATIKATKHLDGFGAVEYAMNGAVWTSPSNLQSLAARPPEQLIASFKQLYWAQVRLAVEHFDEPQPDHFSFGSARFILHDVFHKIMRELTCGSTRSKRLNLYVHFLEQGPGETGRFVRGDVAAPESAALAAASHADKPSKESLLVRRLRAQTANDLPVSPGSDIPPATETTPLDLDELDDDRYSLVAIQTGAVGKYEYSVGKKSFRVTYSPTDFFSMFEQKMEGYAKSDGEVQPIGITHGGCSGDTILADEGGNVWIVGFGEAVGRSGRPGSAAGEGSGSGEAHVLTDIGVALSSLCFEMTPLLDLEEMDIALSITNAIAKFCSGSLQQPLDQLLDPVLLGGSRKFELVWESCLQLLSYAAEYTGTASPCGLPLAFALLNGALRATANPEIDTEDYRSSWDVPDAPPPPKPKPGSKHSMRPSNPDSAAAGKDEEAPHLPWNPYRYLQKRWALGAALRYASVILNAAMPCVRAPEQAAAGAAPAAAQPAEEEWDKMQWRALFVPPPVVRRANAIVEAPSCHPKDMALELRRYGNAVRADLSFVRNPLVMDSGGKVDILRQRFMLKQLPDDLDAGQAATLLAASRSRRRGSERTLTGSEMVRDVFHHLMSRWGDALEPGQLVRIPAGEVEGEEENEEEEIALEEMGRVESALTSPLPPEKAAIERLKALNADADADLKAEAAAAMHKDDDDELAAKKLACAVRAGLRRGLRDKSFAPTLLEAFVRLDTDRSDGLSKLEVRKAFFDLETGMRQLPDEDQLDRLMDFVGMNGSSEITFEALEGFMNLRARVRRRYLTRSKDSDDDDEPDATIPHPAIFEVEIFTDCATERLFDVTREQRRRLQLRGIRRENLLPRPTLIFGGPAAGKSTLLRLLLCRWALGTTTAGGRKQDLFIGVDGVNSIDGTGDIKAEAHGEDEDSVMPEGETAKEATFGDDPSLAWFNEYAEVQKRPWDPVQRNPRGSWTWVPGAAGEDCERVVVLVRMEEMVVSMDAAKAASAAKYAAQDGIVATPAKDENSDSDSDSEEEEGSEQNGADAAGGAEEDEGDPRDGDPFEIWLRHFHGSGKFASSNEGAHMMRQARDQGRLVVLLDGLDEAGKWAAKIEMWLVRQFIHEAQVVITCRVGAIARPVVSRRGAGLRCAQCQQQYWGGGAANHRTR